MLVLPIMLWLGYKEIKPLGATQAIFVLGGSTQREKFAAEFKSVPRFTFGFLEVPQRLRRTGICQSWIDRSRLKLDYQAVDTVTNFTTLVDEFQARGIKKIYLILLTTTCAVPVLLEIVLGSRGIELPVSVPTERSPEPIEKVIRDGARAVLWVATEHTEFYLDEEGQ